MTLQKAQQYDDRRVTFRLKGEQHEKANATYFDHRDPANFLWSGGSTYIYVTRACRGRDADIHIDSIGYRNYAPHPHRDAGRRHLAPAGREEEYPGRHLS